MPVETVHPKLTEFEEKVFRKFWPKYRPGIFFFGLQLEGDGQIAVCAAAHRLQKKGVLLKVQACYWTLTKQGMAMALERQKQQVHQLSIDQTSSGYKRISCACGSSLVHQPWMRATDWNKALRAFEKDHPCP